MPAEELKYSIDKSFAWTTTTKGSELQSFKNYSGMEEYQEVEVFTDMRKEVTTIFH